MDSRRTAESHGETTDSDLRGAHIASTVRILMGELPHTERPSDESYGHEQERTPRSPTLHAFMPLGNSSGSLDGSKKAKKEFDLEVNAPAEVLRSLDGSNGFPELHPREVSLLIGTPSGLNCTLEIPAGMLVVEYVNRFARNFSVRPVALGVNGGSGTVCSLTLQSLENCEVCVEGNAEIVSIMYTFQRDRWGFTTAGSVHIMVARGSGELCGGIVKGDMQAVENVVLNIYLLE